MIKVLFVCLGNICRSPLAEAIFDDKVKRKRLQESIQSDSCGTGAYHIGQQPDVRSIQCANNRGLTLDHLGRQISRQDLQDFDYLIVMDRSNLDNVQQLMRSYNLSHPRLYLMREFQPGADHPDVPDPYFGEADGFEEVFDMLDESLDNLLEQIISDHALYG